MSSRSRVTVICLLAAILVTAVSSHAFVPLGQVWSVPFALYRINPSFPAETGTTSQQITAIRCGANAWRNQAQANFNFIYQGPTSVQEVDNLDGTNAIFYTPDSSGSAALATMFWTWDAFDNFVGFDIVCWGENTGGTIDWSAVGDPTSDTTDLAGTAVHEFGHALGLDHTTVSGATMLSFYTGVGMRTLHQDDIDGVLSLYGSSAIPVSTPVINDVEPPSGPAAGGNSVVIVGDNFTWTDDTILRIDGSPVDPLDFQVVNQCEIVVSDFPAGAIGEVSIEIVNELGSVLLDAAYTYEPLEPILEAVVPDVGAVAGGTPVSIFGFSLIADMEITFDGVPLVDPVFVNGNEIQGLTPAVVSAGLVEVTATSQFSSATLVDGFLYADHALIIESTSASPGATAVPVEVRGNFGSDFEGFTCDVDFDGTFVDVVDVSVVGSVVENADFAGVTINNDPEPAGGFWTLSVIVDSTSPVDPVPAGTDLLLATSTFDTDALAPAETVVPMTFTSAGVTVAGGGMVTPETVDGFLSIGGMEFTRGDADLDGGVNLADGITNLLFQFAGGSASCLDALDVNDDGMLTLVDPIELLGFLFLMGPPPAPPFYVPGLDPTPDSLGCDG